MTGKILFVLTFVTYIALLILNLQRVTATGERLVGWGTMAFPLLAVYIVCSLLLTINIASAGGFNWLSATASSRNIIVGILWLGMAAGVAFCTMLRPEWHTDPTTGWVRSLMMPVYFGATWLPLLMLVPYAILLNPAWRDSISPILYKLPLFMGCILGFLILMAPKIVVSLGITVPQKDRTEMILNNTIKSIRAENSVKELLKYSLDEDEQIRSEAAIKIKADPEWEGELIKILEQTGEYGHHYFYWVYLFLEDNNVEHPDRFIEPVNNTIPALTAEAQRILKKSFLYTGDLNNLNIDGVCRVLGEQFNDSSSVFRPNMLKLQEALETPLLEKHDADDEFVGLLNTYQLAVKNWLDSH